MALYGRKLLPALRDCSHEASFSNYDTLKSIVDGSFNFDDIDAVSGKRKHDDADEDDDVLFVGSSISKVSNM